MPAEDPGWAVSWRTLLWLIIPGLAIHPQRQRANDEDVDGLLAAGLRASTGLRLGTCAHRSDEG